LLESIPNTRASASRKVVGQSLSQKLLEKPHNRKGIKRRKKGIDSERVGRTRAEQGAWGTRKLDRTGNNSTGGKTPMEEAGGSCENIHYGQQISFHINQRKGKT